MRQYLYIAQDNDVLPRPKGDLATEMFIGGEEFALGSYHVNAVQGLAMPNYVVSSKHTYPLEEGAFHLRIGYRCEDGRLHQPVNVQHWTFTYVDGKAEVLDPLMVGVSKQDLAQIKRAAEVLRFMRQHATGKLFRMMATHSKPAGMVFFDLIWTDQPTSPLPIKETP